MSGSPGAFSSAGQSSRTSTRRLTIAQIRHLGILLLSALALLWAIDVAGFIEQGNSHLRYLYYQVRGSQTLSERVVLVAMDEQTGEAWGPPPWSWERYGQLFTAILDGEPTTVGVLEPGVRVLPAEQPRLSPALDRAVASGRLIIPPSTTSGLGQPGLDMERIQHGIESVSLRKQDGRPSITRQILQVAGLEPPLADRLPVHYLGGHDSLPTVPAHRIVTGEIPAHTFQGRIVVIGMRGERFAPLVPTPIGPMSPAEVHAYAIRGLAQDGVWAPMPLWGQWLLRLGLIVSCMLLLPRLGTKRNVVFLAVLVITSIAVDYTLFDRGVLLLGAGGPLAAIAAAAALSWLDERWRVQRELTSLSRAAAKQLAFALAEGPGGARSPEEIWERFARASRTYCRFQSTFLGVLPEDSWHLRFELSLGSELDQIEEMRRDIRREPYKSAYVSHRPVWSSRRFMKPKLELESLLVPLTSLNRILGLWVLNFPKDVQVDRSTLRLIEMLAEQISSTMERQRMRKIFSARSSRRDGLLVRPIQEMRSTFHAFSQEQGNFSKLFDSLPVGVLVATVWGQIEYSNAPMRRFLGSFDVGDVTQQDLPELLALLTDTSEADVHETVMHLLSGKPSVTLSCHAHAGLDPSYQVMLSSLSQSALFDDGDQAASDPGGLSHFVLTVTRQISQDDQAVSQSAQARG